MATILTRTFEEERTLINELSGLPSFFEVCPDVLVIGARYFDMMMAAVLMSRCVWYPLQSINDSTYRGAVAVPANRLVYARKEVGKTGRVFVKYAIGGRPGGELAEQARAFIRTQLRPVDDSERRKALDQLVGIYLDAKEESRKHFREFAGAVEINAG